MSIEVGSPRISLTLQGNAIVEARSNERGFGGALEDQAKIPLLVARQLATLLDLTSAVGDVLGKSIDTSGFSKALADAAGVLAIATAVEHVVKIGNLTVDGGKTLFSRAPARAGELKTIACEIGIESSKLVAKVAEFAVALTKVAVIGISHSGIFMLGTLKSGVNIVFAFTEFDKAVDKVLDKVRGGGLCTRNNRLEGIIQVVNLCKSIVGVLLNGMVFVGTILSIKIITPVLLGTLTTLMVISVAHAILESLYKDQRGDQTAQAINTMVRELSTVQAPVCLAVAG